MLLFAQFRVRNGWTKKAEAWDSTDPLHWDRWRALKEKAKEAYQSVRLVNAQTQTVLEYDVLKASNA